MQEIDARKVTQQHHGAVMGWSILKPGRLVLVRWLDANHPAEGGWEFPDEMAEAALDAIRTVGYVQSVTKEAVRIVQTLASDTVLGHITVPLKGIVTVTRLMNTEPGDCDK